MHDVLYRVRTWMLISAQRALARPGAIEHDGLSLLVSPGVHHPAPVLGIGFQRLQQAALDRIPRGSRVLELGVGAGFWAISAARRGMRVTATDLPHVPLEPVARAAERAGTSLRLVCSDLFEALGDECWDAILFNPPFHDAAPRTPEERAWCGGDVVRRCLLQAPDHLSPGGALHVLIPRIDQRRYARELDRWSVSITASRRYPLLGLTDALELRPR